MQQEIVAGCGTDQIVEDANITVNMSALRKALGENPHEHLYIVTIPGRGYRFVADVSESHNDDDLWSASGVAVEGDPQTQPAEGSAVKREKTTGKQAVSLRGRGIGFAAHRPGAQVQTFGTGTHSGWA